MNDDSYLIGYSHYWSPTKHADGTIVCIPIGEQGEAFHVSFHGKFYFCGNYLDHEEGMRAAMDKMGNLVKGNLDE